MVILNLTQHEATEEQKKEGVIDLPQKYRERLKKLLSFENIPDEMEIRKRANQIYDLIIDLCLEDGSPIKEEVEEIVVRQKDDDFGCKYILIKEEYFKKFGFGFLIGGALWLMKPLIDELKYIGTPLFSFTKREAEEVKQEDGSVKKISRFKHIGFVKAV